MLAAKKVIKTPFIVINADDYYGKEGKILTLIDLVQDGTLDIEIAAAKANMTVDEFKKTMGKAPLKAV